MMNFIIGYIVGNVVVLSILFIGSYYGDKNN